MTKSSKPICKTDSNGTKEWYLNGQLHRTDGPAVEHSNGDKYWLLSGQFHTNPPKSYKPLQLGDLTFIENVDIIQLVGRKDNLACLLIPSNTWTFEWEGKRNE